MGLKIYSHLKNENGCKKIYLMSHVCRYVKMALLSS